MTMGIGGLGTLGHQPLLALYQRQHNATHYAQIGAFEAMREQHLKELAERDRRVRRAMLAARLIAATGIVALGAVICFFITVA